MTSFHRTGYNGHCLYFLHIPRTSGTYIVDNVRSFLLGEGFDDEVSDTDTAKVFISGHVGMNPYYQDEPSFNTFTIVRNPFDQILSTASYAANSAGVFDNDFLEKFLNGENLSQVANPLFNGTCNIQTKMLSCRVVTLEGFDMITTEQPPVNVTFLESDLNKYSSIEEIVGDKTILCFDNREYIEKWISDTLFSMLGSRMGRFGYDTVNSSNRYGIDFSKEQKRHIRDKYELDFELYEYSKRISG